MINRKLSRVEAIYPWFCIDSVTKISFDKVALVYVEVYIATFVCLSILHMNMERECLCFLLLYKEHICWELHIWHQTGTLESLSHQEIKEK